MEIPVIKNEDLYVIGDVHGCSNELQLLLGKLPLTPSSGIVFVGDYIDRGPNARDVVQTVLELRHHVDVYPLLGNHETLLLEFLDEPSSLKHVRFTFNGGGATLQSYSSEGGKFSVDPEHVEFFRSLPLAYQTASHVFVHAGLPPLPLDELVEERDRETLLWVRQPFHRSTYRWNKLVVHGHSRVPEVFRDERRVNVDTGCVYRGKLTAMHIPTGRIYQVRHQRREEHLYLRDSPTSRRKAVRFDGRVEVTFTEPEALPMFHTINYNDFGLLVGSQRPAEKLLEVGQEVAGTLLPQDEKVHVAFRGVVVRVDEIGSVIRYAIRFHRPAKAPD